MTLRILSRDPTVTGASTRRGREVGDALHRCLVCFVQDNIARLPRTSYFRNRGILERVRIITGEVLEVEACPSQSSIPVRHVSAEMDDVEAYCPGFGRGGILRSLTTARSIDH